MPPEEQDGTLTLRALRKDDCVPVCELVLTLFDAFVAPRATPEGRALFVEHTTPGQLERRLAEGHRYWVGLLDGVLAGVVGVGTDHHLYWLWVDASLHHRGIGRRLLEHAVAGVRAEDPGPRGSRCSPPPTRCPSIGASDSGGPVPSSFATAYR